MKLNATLTTIALVFTASVTASIEKIEPMNWWVGMKEPVFQILLYGPQVGDCEVVIHDERVRLQRAETVESRNYLFLYIAVQDGATAGGLLH